MQSHQARECSLLSGLALFVCLFVLAPPPQFISQWQMSSHLPWNVALSPIWYAYNLAAPDCSSAEWQTQQLIGDSSNPNFSPHSFALSKAIFSQRCLDGFCWRRGILKKNNPKKQVWERQMLECHTVICSEMEQLETPGPIVQRLSALSLWPMASSPLIRRNSLTTNLE